MMKQFYHSWCCRISLLIVIATCVEIAIIYPRDELSPRVRRLIGIEPRLNAWPEKSDAPIAPEDIPGVISYIKAHKDHTSLLLLHALHTHNPEVYRTIDSSDKAAILCWALENAEDGGDWGSIRDSGPLLVGVGNEAVPFLVPLLEDAQELPCIEKILSHSIPWRRKDFAYQYICLIRGKRPTLSEDLRERDKQIAILKATL